MIIKPQTHKKKKLPPEKVKKVMSTICKGLALLYPNVDVNLIMKCIDGALKAEQVKNKIKHVKEIK